jgi:hypothetical protein
MEEKQAPQNTEEPSFCIHLKYELIPIPQLGGPPETLLNPRCILKENSLKARVMINEAAAKAWKSGLDYVVCTWGKDFKDCPCFTSDH